MKINENFLKIQNNYLFSDIAKRVAAYAAANPGADLIRLGIGDVTRPLTPSVIDAMRSAVDDMSDIERFKGYPPEWGYDFLRSAINENDFKARGVNLKDSEIYVSDGAKSDCGNIGDIFDVCNIVALCDPVYPVYVDTNVMGGRAGEFIGERWSDIYYMPCVKENHFLPELPNKKVDLVYLCFPNNPTGMAISAAELKKWVDYANENGSVILYDAAYEAFISDGSPHSIFEIEGAKTCAIEFRSFSKTAGFTGVRCSYTIIPGELERGGVNLGALWARRQATKLNGVSYITQKGAEATFSVDGKRQGREIIEYYLNNAKIIYKGLKALGYEVYGGVNAPYIWLRTPDKLTSWEFFDLLLNKVQVVGTPGAGFGPSGEGYFRLTAFNTLENTEEAVKRIAEI
ncbi:MAG: LL-diaminopimelate aminotransferase [Oscillospiraceae bacterium]|nr:LL-diaminopimelate aminotransferase [Oscillospiraceae bacterium]